MKFEWAGIFLLAFYCGEVLWRRWVFGQLPPQLSAVWIYAGVTACLLFAAARALTLRPEWRSRLRKS